MSIILLAVMGRVLKIELISVTVVGRLRWRSSCGDSVEVNIVEEESVEDGEQSDTEGN